MFKRGWTIPAWLVVGVVTGFLALGALPGAVNRDAASPPPKPFVPKEASLYLTCRGRVPDAHGCSPQPDGSYSVTLRFHRIPEGRDPPWSETRRGDPRRGRLSVLLGSRRPSRVCHVDGCARWLSLMVGGEPLPPRAGLLGEPQPTRPQGRRDGRWT